MDRSIEVTLVMVLTPTLVGLIIAVWTLVVSGRARERAARRTSRHAAVEETRRDLAAQLRLLAAMGKGRSTEGMDLAFGTDVYPRADLRLIPDAEALDAFLDFDAQIRAHANAHLAFPGDPDAVARIVQDQVFAALERQDGRIEAGLPPTRLPGIDELLDPHARWTRQRATTEWLRATPERGPIPEPAPTSPAPPRRVLQMFQVGETVRTANAEDPGQVSALVDPR